MFTNGTQILNLNLGEKIAKGKNGDDKNDIINDWHYNRLSMVFYLREGMIKCKNKKLTRNKDKAKLKTRKTLET